MEPVPTPLKRTGDAQTQGQLLGHQELLPTQVSQWPHAAENHQSPAPKNIRKRKQSQTEANLQGKGQKTKLA